MFDNILWKRQVAFLEPVVIDKNVHQWVLNKVLIINACFLEVTISVPEVTVTCNDAAAEDECKWFIAIWFILLKQIWHWLRYMWYLNNIYTHRQGSLKNAHSVHARSSSSCLTLLSFFLLLYVAVDSFLAGSWLHISLPVWGARPSIIPPSRVDPISLRSQAHCRVQLVGNKKCRLCTVCQAINAVYATSFPTDKHKAAF